MSNFTPKNYKYKKQHKGKLTNKINKPQLLTNTISIGSISLMALENGRLTPNHLLCCTQLLNKKTKKLGQINLKVFPHTPITKKPLEIRMGKGKGAVDTHVFNVFTGTTLIELEGNNIHLLKKNLEQIKIKLPIKTKIIHEI
jgi:large subunit ribosomal protein L16